MKPNVRRKLTAVLFVVLIMGGVLVYAETMAPNLLDFPNAILNIGSIDTGQGAGELYAMDQDLQTSDAVTFGTINTGQGANELYDMDQNVQTTDEPTFQGATVDWLQIGAENRTDWPSAGGEPYDQNLNTTEAVTFATVDTGQGAKEIYSMDQDITTGDDVVFATVDTGQGANELYDMDQNVKTTDEPTFQGATVDWFQIGAVNRTTWPSGGTGTGLPDYPFDFYFFNNASGMYALDHTGSIVKSDTNKSEVIQYGVDNLGVRGGTLVFGSMETGLSYSVIFDHLTGIEIIGAGPGTQTSVAYMGATQLNSEIAGDAMFKFIGCEGITIRNLYFYTSRTDNYGILIDGGDVYPEHFLIEGVHIRKFLRCIYFKDVWASNVGGQVRNNHFSTIVGGYCIYGEDLNGWSFSNNVFSGNARKGDGVYLCDGDMGRIPRVDFFSNQFIGCNRSFLILNSTTRAVGINVFGGNMETLNATTGVAAIWLVNADTFSTITVYGTTFQSLAGKPAFKTDEPNNVKVLFLGCFGQGDTLIDMTNNPNVQVIGGHNFNVSNLRGEKLGCTNPSGKTVTTGTKYTAIIGQLSSTTTEARTQWEVPFDGYIKNLRVRCNGAGAGNVTINVEGVQSALKAEWAAAAGDGWYTDTSDYVAVSDGEMLTVRMEIKSDTIFYFIEIEYVHP